MSMWTDGGSSPLEQRQQLLDVVGHLDGVGAGLALDAENDGALLVVVRVEPGRGLVVLHAVDDVAQILQAHRRAVAIGHHQRSILRRRSSTDRWPAA